MKNYLWITGNNMTKITKTILISLLLAFSLAGCAYNGNEILGGTKAFPTRGGTGTTEIPSYGDVLVGNSGGTYDPTATSTLFSSISPHQGNFTAGTFTATSTTATSTFPRLSITTGISLLGEYFENFTT